MILSTTSLMRKKIKMFKIIKEIKSKKIYHYFKENKGTDTLFIFENEDHYKICSNFITILKEKFKGIKISIMYLYPKKPGILVNTICIEHITKEKLGSRFDIVFIIPLVYDAYEANTQLFGLPISVERIKNEQDDLIEYYGMGKFIIFNLDENVQYSKIADIIDKLYYQNIFVVLIGNSSSIAEVCNLSKTNPIAIFNNIYLVNKFMEKSLSMLNSNNIDDFESVMVLLNAT